MIFFFASAAASSAYLTVSESFPLEMRALAIALFYALGTGVGGVAAPWLFGALIEHRRAAPRCGWGYAIGAALMLIAAAAHRLALGRRRRAALARRRRAAAVQRRLSPAPASATATRISRRARAASTVPAPDRSIS